MPLGCCSIKNTSCKETKLKKICNPLPGQYQWQMYGRRAKQLYIYISVQTIDINRTSWWSYMQPNETADILVAQYVRVCNSDQLPRFPQKKRSNQTKLLILRLGKYVVTIFFNLPKTSDRREKIIKNCTILVVWGILPKFISCFLRGRWFCVKVGGSLVWHKKWNTTEISANWDAIKAFDRIGKYRHISGKCVYMCFMKCNMWNVYMCLCSCFIFLSQVNSKIKW